MSILLSYIKIAVRHLRRYRGLASINLFGLALGMACTFFILLWVQDELSFDRFHENADVLYRVEQDQFYSGEAYHVTVTPYPPGPVFKSDIPEVVDATRFVYLGTRLVGQSDRHFYENGILATDPSTFDMFTFPFVDGDPESALINPNSIVLSEDMALKYFASESPIGKTLTIDNDQVMTVTGVFRDVPSNSSFGFDMVVPFEFLKATGQYRDNWGSNSILTFVQLQQGADLAAVNQKLTDVVNANREEESPTRFMAMPLTDIHLKAYFGYGHPMGNIKYVYVFSTIALFVLLIACINFMNLSTARSARRAKEIGLRKTSGAGRASVARQFLSETVFLSFLALLIATAIVSLLIGPSNALTGKELGPGALMDARFILGAVAIALLTGLIAGSYPAFYLSSFRPADILKGTASIGSGNVAFRRVLVVLQFGLSIFLVIGTAVVYSQLNYMKEKDLGYDKDHLVTIRMRDEVRNSFATLKSEWLGEPGILGVTAASFAPTQLGSNSSGVDWDGKDPDQTVLIGTGIVDFDFTETLGIQLADGRSFSEDYPSDVATDTVGSAFLINQSTAELMGKENVVGEEFSFMGTSGRIVGVMEDFNYNSLRNDIEPMALLVNPERLRFAILRLDPSDVSASVDQMEAAWNRVVPTFPFEFSFVDEDFDRMYRSEERMSQLLGYFSVVAILIACLGLVGLAAYMAEQRRREISIRKVLGASQANVSFLLCREFLILIAVANVIAWPVAWFASSNWLESFAYRADLQVTVFILVGVAAFFVAILTVSYQAIRAALTNPAEALNYE